MPVHPSDIYTRNRSKPGLLVFMVFTLFFCLSGNAISAEHGITFAPGEKMTFQVRWAFIPAGEAVIELLPEKNLNGIQSLHFLYTN